MQQDHDITTYLYLPHETRIVHSVAFKLVLPIHSTAHRIIIFVNSTGVLHLKGHFIRAVKGSAFLLAPGAMAHIEFGDSANIENAVYLVDFHAYRLGEQQPVHELGSYLPYETIINSTHLSVLFDRLKQYEMNSRPISKMTEIEIFRQQTRLQELLLLLIDHVQNTFRVSDANFAVERTISYMDQHYRENITVEQLYTMSGVGRWQYSALFQSLTGKKPLDYLTSIRLNRAKELLVQTNDSLRKIAHQVGFNEESYFSRKFRQTLGITPRQYVESVKMNDASSSSSQNRFKRVVSIGYTLGDILSLGIKPVGADTRVIGKRVLFRDELKDIADIGLLGEPGKIRELNPDLIIYSSFRKEWVEELSQIAPTILIDRDEHTYTRLLLIADIFNKQEQAHSWIQQHKLKCDEFWTHYSIHKGNHQTATIFILAEGSLYIMGMKGFGLTLYHPLAFQPSEKVKELIETNLPFRMIHSPQMGEYRADVHFLLVDEDPLSKQEAVQIMQSRFWKSLRSNQAYVTEAKWNFDDPITMDQLLIQLPRILQAL